MAELEQARPDALILDVHLADRDDGWALAEVVAMLGQGRYVLALGTAALHLLGSLLLTIAGLRTVEYFFASAA